MLSFFRRFAPWFAGVVVVAMVASLGAGLVMVNQAPRAVSDDPSIGSLGPINIDASLYMVQLSDLLQQYRIDPNGLYDPEIIESVQMAALDYTVNASVFLYEATQLGLKPSGAEMDVSMANLQTKYKVSSLKALKELFKQQGIPYDTVLANMKKNLTIQLYLNRVNDAIVMTDQDVMNQYQLLTYDALFIPYSSTMNGTVRAKALSDQLAKGTLFDRLLSQAVAGQLPMVVGLSQQTADAHQLPLVLERAMHALPLQTVSPVIETPLGWYIVRVTAHTPKSRPITLNMTVEIPKVKEIKQRQAFGLIVRRALTQYAINWTQPDLQTLYDKGNQQWARALEGYARQSSSAPYDPRPHYMASLLYEKLNRPADQRAELEKAALKGLLTPRLRLPMVDAYLARFVWQEGRVASANALADAAVTAAQGNYTYMKRTASVLEAGGFKGPATRLQTRLLELENAAARQQQQPISANMMRL